MDSLDAVLYPPIAPLRTGTLDVGEGHTLYWETCGNPAGLPAVFLHGGPGAGIGPTSRRFFDPSRWHVALFDQRGCGQSTPLGCTEANTTAHLIADIERLREHLGIARWLVFGGSWGSTLALAYAQAHPTRCTGLVLRGIWLASQAETTWWLYGMRNFFPREWEAFSAHVGHAPDLLGAYLARMRSPDAAVAQAAARALARYEGACLHLLPQPPATEEDEARLLSTGLLEAHYFAHQAFLAPDQLLGGMPRIAHLPGIIVHGRYDVVCPVRYACALADAWPGVDLRIVPAAGHSSLEPGIAAALVAATDAMAQRLAPAGWVADSV